MHTPSTLTIA